MKKLVVFDLDGTLAQSKSALDDEMANLLAELSSVAKVSIISGGDWPQFEKQVLGRLPANGKLDNFYLLPTCGTKFFEYKNGTWEKLYSEDLSPDQKKKIISSLEQAISETGFQPKETWGERIEDRGTQITYSALGQQAPLDAKKTWDPDFAEAQEDQSGSRQDDSGILRSAWRHNFDRCDAARNRQSLRHAQAARRAKDSVQRNAVLRRCALPGRQR